MHLVSRILLVEVILLSFCLIGLLSLDLILQARVLVDELSLVLTMLTVVLLDFDTGFYNMDL